MWGTWCLLIENFMQEEFYALGRWLLPRRGKHKEMEKQQDSKKGSEGVFCQGTWSTVRNNPRHSSYGHMPLPGQCPHRAIPGLSLNSDRWQTMKWDPQWKKSASFPASVWEERDCPVKTKFSHAKVHTFEGIQHDDKSHLGSTQPPSYLPICQDRLWSRQDHLTAEPLAHEP